MWRKYKFLLMVLVSPSLIDEVNPTRPVYSSHLVVCCGRLEAEENDELMIFASLTLVHIS